MDGDAVDGVLAQVTCIGTTGLVAVNADRTCLHVYPGTVVDDAFHTVHTGVYGPLVDMGCLGLDRAILARTFQVDLVAAEDDFVPARFELSALVYIADDDFRGRDDNPRVVIQVASFADAVVDFFFHLLDFLFVLVDDVNGCIHLLVELVQHIHPVFEDEILAFIQVYVISQVHNVLVCQMDFSLSLILSR